MAAPTIIRKKLDEDLSEWPELKPYMGKDVEILIRESLPSKSDRWEILDRVAQLDALDLDAIRQQDEVEWAAAREMYR